MIEDGPALPNSILGYEGKLNGDYNPQESFKNFSRTQVSNYCT
jgi:hypothetical protein